MKSPRECAAGLMRTLGMEPDPWQVGVLESPPSPARWAKKTIPEQYAVLITCRDEAQQVELLTRLHAEGLDCKALLS